MQISSNIELFPSANGCSDPKPPVQAWYKRNGNEAVIGCETSDKEWRLTCTGNTWSGKTGNCTKTGGIKCNLHSLLLFSMFHTFTLLQINVFMILFIAMKLSRFSCDCWRWHRREWHCRVWVVKCGDCSRYYRSYCCSGCGRHRLWSRLYTEI